jgi:tRNA threonylcarbamoyladenosine biosynthesis protein TsaB
MILILDTAQSKTYLALHDQTVLTDIEWEAARNLSSQILDKLNGLYKKAGREIHDTDGIVVHSGPGSFTGLRIGLSVANTFAYALDIPIVGICGSASRKELIDKGLGEIADKKKFSGSVIPVYGSEPKITKPR